MGNKFCSECGAPIQDQPTGFVRRRFEFRDWVSNSYKFWEIWLHGWTVFTRYGRIGTDGTQVVKEFDSAWQARDYRQDKIREKLRHGYVEV